MMENITIVSVYFKMNVIKWHVAGLLDHLHKSLHLLCSLLVDLLLIALLVPSRAVCL